MGQEQSTIYEGPPEVLESRDLQSVVKYIKSGKCKRIFVMVCALRDSFVSPRYINSTINKLGAGMVRVHLEPL